MPNGPRAVGITLLSALAASQAALVVLNPLLPDVARDLDVSVATAGQLRTVSGLAAGAAALATGLLAARVGLRGLMLGALVILAVGSLVSARRRTSRCSPLRRRSSASGSAVSYSAAIAATAEWSTEANRSRVLALTLLGPPLAWIVGMPLVGILGEIDWRIAWLVVPVAMALVAAGLLLRQHATPPASARAGLRSVLDVSGRRALDDRGALRVLGMGRRARLHGRAARRVIRPVDRGDGARARLRRSRLRARELPLPAVGRRARPSPARRSRAGRRGHGRVSRCVPPVRVGQRGALLGPLLHRRGPNARGERPRARARSGASARSDRRSRRRDPGRLLRRSGRRWSRARDRRLRDARARVRSALRGRSVPHLVPLR